MKKILALAAVSLLAVCAASALDLSGVKGTWQDAKWDANWTFAANGTIELTKASSGEKVFTFTDNNVSDFDVNASVSGVSISFYCKETERAYKFTKPATLDADLTMTVNPDWTTEDYDTSIKFQR
ncbi:MAG: hypothetical protein K6F15_06890 [Treponema sp.]|nr:hypothetical protein [Treponema sp.]